MPHPKNRLKLTGDVHPPELDLDLDLDRDLDMEVDVDDGTAQGGTRSVASWQPPAPANASFMAAADAQRTPAARLPTQGTFDAARQQVMARPFATVGAAFALGFVLARLFR